MKLMGVRCECRRWRMAAVAALVLWAALPALGAKEREKTPEPPKPAARIPVGALGFLPPNPHYLQMRLAWSTLDFIDDDHLLFTFHVNQLLHRSPDDAGHGSGQMIHAVVLDIASGKVVRTADWRMYDRGPYLWGLRGGQFLVRRANALYLTDSSLNLRPYLMFPTDLEGVEVSPERTMLLLELKKVLPAAKGEVTRRAPSLLGPGEAEAQQQEQRTRTEMVLLRPGEHRALGRAEFQTMRAVPLLEDGVVNMLNGDNPKQWVLEEETIERTVKKLGKVVSDCAPEAQALSRDVVLTIGCPLNGSNGNTVAALKVGGGVLWQDKWSSRYIWPTFAYAQNGSRFAYESMQANREIGAMDSFGETDIVGQPVGVFDTDTGKLVLVTYADPIMSEGQNYALSADGRRFAVLRNGAIEVFDLPPVGEQQASASAGHR